MHLAILFVLPQFVALTWWQYHRAMSGNTLSWAYTFEWPIFGGYAVFMWWKLVHDPPNAGNAGNAADRSAATPAAATSVATTAGPLAAPGPVAPGSTAAGGTAEDAGDAMADDDPELAAYNRYLAGLSAGGRQKRW